MQDNIATPLVLADKGFQMKLKKEKKKRRISDIGKNPVLYIPTCDAKVLSKIFFLWWHKLKLMVA